GLTGSYHYVKMQLPELKEEKAHLVNIDSIRIPEEVCLIKRETMNGTVFDKSLLEKVQSSFKAKNLPIKTGSTPIGGTDGVFFVRAGIPAVSMIGLGMDKLDPTYHTRLDVVDNLSEVALNNVKTALIDFTEKWDSQ
ncbi:MAG TPA: M28 family peptidase, partial [Chitinophagales bacterium]|nr:M28 family peptidase [Chitinophagales bacterium]